MTISILACLFSPRLYRIYSRANFDVNSQIYQSNIFEQCGDFAISYLFPAGMVYSVWHRKFQYVMYLTAFLASSYAIRSVGRAFNPTYMTFLQMLKRAGVEANTENMEAIRRYDFDFKGWPVGFTGTRICKAARLEALSQQQGIVSKFSLSWVASWLVAHTFGIRLIYPGLLLGPMLRNYLEEGRGKFITQFKGLRAKVVSADGYYIDTIFFDRRREVDTTKGKTLVICCEGNAGFWEIGMAGTPINEGYSVLGWNHPGFGGSSGTPYPVNELNAAEAVFEYAIKELGFKEEDIIVYGWSIGGYPAVYLASEHSNIKGLIVDATFDDILPLAIPRMPEFMSGLVRATIRNHVDLRISKQLEPFKGPIRIIRRTEDEIIADPPSSLSGNRGNYLLVDVLRQRYPNLLDNEVSERSLREWLSRPHVKESDQSVDQSEILIANMNAVTDAEKSTLLLKIADKILTDYKSTHCTPLSADLFLLPWKGVQQQF